MNQSVLLREQKNLSTIYLRLTQLESLKNYALPDFILALFARECNSDLAERGRIDKKLHSMNEESIELLYKIFVKCDKNESGQYAQYRFYAFVASMYYKCEVLINEVMPGKSGKNYKLLNRHRVSNYNQSGNTRTNVTMYDRSTIL